MGNWQVVNCPRISKKKDYSQKVFLDTVLFYTIIANNIIELNIVCVKQICSKLQIKELFEDILLLIKKIKIKFTYFSMLIILFLFLEEKKLDQKRSALLNRNGNI